MDNESPQGGPLPPPPKGIFLGPRFSAGAKQLPFPSMTAEKTKVSLSQNLPLPRSEIWPLSRLKPADYNPRKIDQVSLDRLAKSLAEFGNLQPIVVNVRTGNIVGGHQKLKCLLFQRKSETEVWLVDLDPLKEKAANLTLNNFAGTWDTEALDKIISELKAANIDLDLTGFAPDSLDEILASLDEPVNDVDAEPQIDQADALREKWGVELGQVWQLGEHRITCGDATSEEVVKRVLAGDLPHLMVTDPPYGVEYDASWRNEVIRADGSKVEARAVGKVANDDRADWRDAWEQFPGDVAYVWHAGMFAPVVAESLAAADFNIRAQIVWAKNQFAIGRGDYHWQHEPCWYAVRKGKVGHYCGDRSQSTLWEIDKPKKSETGHSTQKPVECMERPIRNNSKRGDLVYEPFSGSGTTIIACERTGRKCRAIELNPGYVAVAIQRWVDATKGSPRKLA